MNREELKRLEEALQTDEALRARYGEALERAADREKDPARVAAKAAAELGFALDTKGAEPVGDEALDGVAG